MGARRHGQEGAHAPLWKCCKVFLCITYSKTLSRLIIYVLFSQPVVGFAPKPSRDLSLGGLSSPISSLPTPVKNPAGAHETGRPCDALSYYPWSCSVSWCLAEGCVNRGRSCPVARYAEGKDFHHRMAA